MPAPKHVIRPRNIIQQNLDWHALNDLDVIARRVFGRQQAESRAGARLNAVHMPLESRCG